MPICVELKYINVELGNKHICMLQENLMFLWMTLWQDWKNMYRIKGNVNSGSINKILMYLNSWKFLKCKGNWIRNLIIIRSVLVLKKILLKSRAPCGTPSTYETKVQALTFTCIKIPQLFISDCLTPGWMLWNLYFLAWEGYLFVRILLPCAGHKAKANLNSETARLWSLWGYKKFLRKSFGVKSFEPGFLFCLLIYQTSGLLIAPTFAGCYMYMCHALQLITPFPL